MPSELEFLTELTFHGMHRRSWNSDCMNELINDLGGELVSMFVPLDSWALMVMAWMKKPSTIPKVIGVEITTKKDTSMTFWAEQNFFVILMTLL